MLSRDWADAVQTLSREMKEFLHQVVEAIATRNGGAWPGGTTETSLSKRSGALVAAILGSVRVDGSTFATLTGQIGAPGIVYARIQELGGTITAKNGKFLCIPLPAALDSNGLPLQSTPPRLAEHLLRPVQGRQPPDLPTARDDRHAALRAQDLGDHPAAPEHGRDPARRRPVLRRASHGPDGSRGDEGDIMTGGHIKRGPNTSPTYRVWADMRSRCTNPKHHKWGRYGARGVTVCSEWSSFEVFLADMGPKPSGMSLERKDNDGPYSANNCIWATPKQQANNRSTSRRLTAFGRTQTISQWAEEAGISRATLCTRLFRCGWPLEKAAMKGA